MKVYISADIEGISGLRGISYPQDERDTDYAKQQMIEDVNAAVEGAVLAGVTEVVVRDAHGRMGNLMADRLHPASTLLSGNGIMMSMVDSIGPNFDALFMIGYHGMAGAREGVWPHTLSGIINKLVINGEEVGEATLSSYMAGHFGVPAVMLSGDKAATEELLGIQPNAAVVSVKRKLVDGLVEVVHPETARDKIRDMASEAIQRIDEMPPICVEPPVTMEITLARREMVQMASYIPTVSVKSEDTIVFECPDIIEAHKVLRVVEGVSWSLR